MANKKHLKILLCGVGAWNRWRYYFGKPCPDFGGADLKQANLSGAELSGADFSCANLEGANFSGAYLDGANLIWANLCDADLVRTSFFAAQLHGADLRGANLWRADLQAAHLGEVTLGESSVPGAYLNDPKFIGSKVLGANLSSADLSEADLRRADLTKANLSKAKLDRADLAAASLRYTNLREARLHAAIFDHTLLKGADITDATLAYTQFGGVDLSGVVGLETVRHDRPSSIGIDTVYLSHGKIPIEFLRGAGVPEKFSEYIHSLIGTALEYHSCFISYSNKDQEFVTRLHADLQAKGVRCWFAPEDLRIGEKLRPAFDEAILVHDKLMVILSATSVKSTWVEKEVETAFEKERQQDRIVLFPIRLDDAVMETKEAWAADIRRARHIGDFRDWKNHDSYRRAFDRLLRDLRTEDRADSSVQE